MMEEELSSLVCLHPGPLFMGIPKVCLLGFPVFFQEDVGAVFFENNRTGVTNLLIFWYPQTKRIFGFDNDFTADWLVFKDTLENHFHHVSVDPRHSKLPHLCFPVSEAILLFGYSQVPRTESVWTRCLTHCSISWIMPVYFQFSAFFFLVKLKEWASFCTLMDAHAMSNNCYLGAAWALNEIFMSLSSTRPMLRTRVSSGFEDASEGGLTTHHFG